MINLLIGISAVLQYIFIHKLVLDWSWFYYCADLKYHYGCVQGWGSETFSSDPDLDQLEKKSDPGLDLNLNRKGNILGRQKIR